MYCVPLHTVPQDCYSTSLILEELPDACSNCLIVHLTCFSTQSCTFSQDIIAIQGKFLKNIHKAVRLSSCKDRCRAQFCSAYSTSARRGWCTTNTQLATVTLWALLSPSRLHPLGVSHHTHGTKALQSQQAALGQLFPDVTAWGW